VPQITLGHERKFLMIKGAHTKSGAWRKSKRSKRFKLSTKITDMMMLNQVKKEKKKQRKNAQARH